MQLSRKEERMNRKEHLQWCKDRALQYVESNDLNGAMGSMLSDLRRHEETKDHPAGPLMLQLKMIGALDTPEEMRKYINDFN